jgi:hypothetical protein
LPQGGRTTNLLTQLMTVLHSSPIGGLNKE